MAVTHPAWPASIASAAALLFSGCAGPEQVRYEEALDEAPPAAAHALHDERLAQVMRSLERIDQDRLPQAMDTRLERRQGARRVAALAAAMAESAASIPNAMPQDQLSAAERSEFLALVELLQSRSLDLSRKAPDLTLAQMREELARIDSVCAACHERFRPYGPVEGP